MMDSKIMDKIAQGMVLSGLGYLIYAVTKMPKQSLEHVQQMIASGDSDGIKQLAEGHQPEGHDEKQKHVEIRPDDNKSKDDNKPKEEDLQKKIKQLEDQLKQQKEHDKLDKREVMRD